MGVVCVFFLSQDLNWRSQITKENERHIREQRDLAERLAGGATTSANVEIETAKRIFGDSNLMTKLQQRQDPDHKGLAVRSRAGSPAWSAWLSLTYR